MKVCVISFFIAAWAHQRDLKSTSITKMILQVIFFHPILRIYTFESHKFLYVGKVWIIGRAYSSSSHLNQFSLCPSLQISTPYFLLWELSRDVCMNSFYIENHRLRVSLKKEWTSLFIGKYFRLSSFQCYFNY